VKEAGKISSIQKKKTDEEPGIHRDEVRKITWQKETAILPLFLLCFF
jgi:hypothetical protein